MSFFFFSSVIFYHFCTTIREGKIHSTTHKRRWPCLESTAKESQSGNLMLVILILSSWPHHLRWHLLQTVVHLFWFANAVAVDPSGHCPHDERPEAVNSIIQEWVVTVGARVLSGGRTWRGSCWMNFLCSVFGKEPFRLGLWSVSPASGNCKFLRSGSSSTIYAGSLWYTAAIG